MAQQIKKVGVLGAGLMGHGIAQVAAQAGYEVVLREVDDATLAKGIGKIEKQLARAVEKGKASQEDADAVRGRIHGTTDYQRARRLRSRDRGDHREPAAEARDVDGGRSDRQARGRLRDQHLLAGGDRPGGRDRPPGAVRRPALLQPGAGDEARRGRALRDDLRRGVRDRRSAFARSEGKLAIPTKDKAGFIVNRLLVPYMLDAMRAYEEGVGSVARDRRGDEGRRGASDGSADAGGLRRARHARLDLRRAVRRVPRAALRAPADAAQDARARAGSGASRGWASTTTRASADANPDLEQLRADLEDASELTDLGKAQQSARSAGGPERHREKALEQGKLPVRERVALLLDEGSFAEEALLANWQQDGLGADGVVTGVGTIDGRPVALMANDPTVKAGSWGPKTVEKILRIQERALTPADPDGLPRRLRRGADHRAGADVPGPPRRRADLLQPGALSGVVPQVCVLFGPSAAGGAYIPAFCDIVIMREGNASMYLGSPRMAEMVIGEKVSLEEMGGARMHTGVSGCGHQLVKSDEEGIALAQALPLLPAEQLAGAASRPPRRAPRRARASTASPIAELIPADENKPFDMKELIAALVDEELAAGDPSALGEGADRRLRAPRRPRDRDRRQPAQAQGRRAVRRLRRQGRALHLDAATRSTCRCCSSPTCPAS